MIQQTSLMAYDEAKKNLNRTQSAILNVFEQTHPTSLCNQDVANWLAWGINRVTPRTGELIKKGLLEHKGFIKHNGRKVIALGLKTESNQKELF